jgi:hypothetical protein
MSRSPTLAKKEYEFAKVLYDLGHDIMLFHSRTSWSFTSDDEDRDIDYRFIDTESPIEFAYQIHLRFMSRSYSVVLGHSFQSPLFFEVSFGGTPMVIIHDESYIFDSVENEEVDRSKLWTQHLMIMRTMQAAEKVVVYSKNQAESLLKSGIEASVITEPAPRLEFGEEKVDDRVDVVIVTDNEDEAKKIIKSDFGESFGIKVRVSPREIHKNKSVFQDAFVALVLCDAPSLDILKYGCSVVKYASDKPTEPLVRYVSPDQGLDSLLEGVMAAHRYDKDVSGGEKKRIEDFFSERTYDKIVESEFGDILNSAIPVAIARGRTRGW